jgi:hypothetical protein
MKAIINHETYEQIVYDESAWTGKKTLMVNGKYLTKIDKKTFFYSNGQERQYFVLGGNFLKGAFVTVGKDKIQLTPPVKWYEMLLPILVFITLLVWGSSPSLVLIFPLVGGALGGLIDGIGVVLSVLAMKSIKNVPLKLLAWLGLSVLTVLVNFLVTTFLIAALI